MILAAAIGTSVAWAVNYNRYAHRDAEFGPLTWDREVNAENVADVIVQDDQVLLPRAELVGDTLHDFGVMAPGDEGEHTFTIRNSGEDTLSLEIGATTCKCTLGSLGKDSLEPGEETSITLSWTVKTNKAAFAQSAEVRTNDPAKLILKLEVVGQVVREIAWVPEAWVFGEVGSEEGFEVQGKLFTYFDEEVIPTKQKFSSDSINDLAEITVTPFEPSESDGTHKTAKQAFNVVAKVKPGMRQGDVSTNLSFGFQRKDKDGKIVQEEGDDDPNDYAVVEVAGRIVGALRMIETPKLKESGGAYIYAMGKLKHDKPEKLKAKALVVLNGAYKDNTTLRIGKVTPDGNLRATISEPKGRGDNILYTLTVEVVPGDKPLDYRGLKGDDFGLVLIESDNPKVPTMRLAVKFAVDAKQ